ncbi:MAG: hypothetical protein ACT4PJ_06720 [Gemmatimonadaceae bacterium]
MIDARSTPVPVLLLRRDDSVSRRASPVDLAAASVTPQSILSRYWSTTMDSESNLLTTRVEQLERRMRGLRLLASTAGIALLATWLLGATLTSQSDVIRAKVLIIEDADGRERIVLGAPMPDRRQVVGMKILSPEGAEQFGLTIKPDGGIGMGFDVKPGVGDPRNRERLNLGVTATGRGWIRYLDNKTRARLWIMLDSADAPVVQFLDWPDDEKIVVRQIGFAGDTTLQWTR